jgi:hypothetical protein
MRAEWWELDKDSEWLGIQEQPSLGGFPLPAAGTRLMPHRDRELVEVLP